MAGRDEEEAGGTGVGVREEEELAGAGLEEEEENDEGAAVGTGGRGCERALADEEEEEDISDEDERGRKAKRAMTGGEGSEESGRKPTIESTEGKVWRAAYEAEAEAGEGAVQIKCRFGSGQRRMGAVSQPHARKPW